MKAIVLIDTGGVENLIETELPKPVPAKGDVQIMVKAISINPVDIKTRKGAGVYGRIKEENPIILGWDISGVVTKTGEGVSKFKEGDQVFGMINFPGHGKAYAEYVTAPASQLSLKPTNASHIEAAATTLAALTAWQVLKHHANVTKGQKVLIHAAAGGVGHFAVQMAKYLGATIIGTASAANHEFIKSLGASQVIDYTKQDFGKVVGDLDMVLDTIGGDVMKRSLNVLKRNGTLISIPSGMSPELATLAKEKSVNGYSILVKSDGTDMEQLATFLQQGIIKPSISEIFPFEKMKEAHLKMETGRTRGKIVVTV